MPDYKREIENFQEIAQAIKPSPGDIPELKGISIYGEPIGLHGPVSGDHITYVDFKKRFDLERRIEIAREMGREDIVAKLEHAKTRAGIIVADASGHNITDALLVAMFHQAFMLGARYSMDEHGEVTAGLFEKLNSRFYSSRTFKLDYITMIYGEISESGVFRFILAGHHPPIVYSSLYDKFMPTPHFELSEPVGLMLSKSDIDRRVYDNGQSLRQQKEPYRINQWELMGGGDIIILHTDGFYDSAMWIDEESPMPAYGLERLEKKLREVKRLDARQIWEEVKADFLTVPQTDDATFVVIKKHTT